MSDRILRFRNRKRSYREGGGGNKTERDNDNHRKESNKWKEMFLMRSSKCFSCAHEFPEGAQVRYTVVECDHQKRGLCSKSVCSACNHKKQWLFRCRGRCEGVDDMNGGALGNKENFQNATVAQMEKRMQSKKKQRVGDKGGIIHQHVTINNCTLQQFVLVDLTSDNDN